MQLSLRLSAIAGLVTRENRLVDVGCRRTGSYRPGCRRSG